MTRDAINMNKVILPGGKRASIHGRLTHRHTLAGEDYSSAGYIYHHGRRVYGTARVWDYNCACFTMFTARGKWAWTLNPSVVA